MINVKKHLTHCHSANSRGCVWVSQDHRGTINPYDCGKSDVHTIKIFPNSYGPIDSNSYNRSACKILFLLKESYISVDNFLTKEDRGGHDQSKERYDDPRCDNNRTYINIINCSSEILSIMGCLSIPYSEMKNEQKDDCFRNNVCILNVNKYPGIGTSSNDNLIAKWASINTETIKEEIKEFSPRIIIGCGTLNHFFSGENFKIQKICEWYEKNSPDCGELHTLYNNKLLSLLGYDIPLVNPSNGEFNLCNSSANDYYTYFSKDIIIINASHPTSRQEWQKNICEVLRIARDKQKHIP